MTMAATEKTSIYEYLDFRAYLRDEIARRKESQHGFSFRAFNMRSGFKSPSHLSMITNGEINAGAKAVTKLCKGLNLSSRESKFFATLVNFNQATTHIDKDNFYNALLKLYPPRQPNLIGEKYYKIFNRWYHATILELVRLECFQEDPYWIAEQLKPRVSVPKVRHALDTLCEYGLLVRDDANRLVPAEPNLTTPDSVASLAIINYNKQLIARSAQAVEHDPASQKEFSSITVAMSEQTFADVKKRIQEFRDELHAFTEERASNDPTSCVANINLQLFTTTDWSNS